MSPRRTRPDETHGPGEARGSTRPTPAVAGEQRKVAVLMGSSSDRERMQPALEVLSRLGVPAEARVLSAHRSPEEVARFARGAKDAGFGVVICGAGMAAHLAGAVAANTTLPVVGVPLSGGLLGGLDALLATVQMPRGVPVATVAVDGAANAGVLAAQILSLSDPELEERLLKLRAEASSPGGATG